MGKLVEFLPKIIGTLIGGSGRGSRRLQFATLCGVGVYVFPNLAWHFVSLATVVVAGLTVTDVCGKAD